MKRILAAALLICASAAAFAQSAADAMALAGSQSQSGSASLAVSNPVAQSSSAQGVGNAQTITFNSAPVPAATYQQVEHTGTSTIRTTPQVYAPPVGVTAPCRVALAGGLSIVGVGVAGGGSVGDTPCNLRELSRLYHGIGNAPKAVAVADAALALECQNEEVAKALGNLCPAPKAGQVAPVAYVEPVAAPVPPPPAQGKTGNAAPVCKQVTENGITTTVCPL